jgi:septum formation protein
MNFPKIYLASASPRRSELLTQIGVEYTQRVSNLDETVHSNETAETYVVRVARDKAKAIWQQLPVDDRRPVLAADTAVIVDDLILGKPVSAEDAMVMLRRLSGKSHRVITCVLVMYQQHVLQKMNSSEVIFKPLTEQELNWYVATQEGLDKAGAYAVQGRAAMFIKQIHGSYSGIMGLPLDDTAELLQQIGKLIDE